MSVFPSLRPPPISTPSRDFPSHGAQYSPWGTSTSCHSSATHIVNGFSEAQGSRCAFSMRCVYSEARSRPWSKMVGPTCTETDKSHGNPESFLIPNPTEIPNPKGHSLCRSLCEATGPLPPETLIMQLSRLYYTEGHLLRHMPKALLKALITKPVTANFHHFCVTPKNFSDFGVDKVYRPLAYSCDKRGVEYVAMAEGKDFPFFAVQFHPEKAPYEWTTAPGHNEIPHTRVAVHLSAFLADVFISKARRSTHRFANATEESASLIYNFPALYTGAKSPLEQVYVF
ncbi:gamma-glutamyl hydrolase-like [Penaeus indicus]|uniref:gamma-glutamyl hydrolase-like n=1 Tax=Penaeus indicus TaxID=29960 RepID=UPI00300C40B2